MNCLNVLHNGWPSCSWAWSKKYHNCHCARALLMCLFVGSWHGGSSMPKPAWPTTQASLRVRVADGLIATFEAINFMDLPLRLCRITMFLTGYVSLYHIATSSWLTYNEILFPQHLCYEWNILGKLFYYIEIDLNCFTIPTSTCFLYCY